MFYSTLIVLKKDYFLLYRPLWDENSVVIWSNI